MMKLIDCNFFFHITYLFLNVMIDDLDYLICDIDFESSVDENAELPNQSNQKNENKSKNSLNNKSNKNKKRPPRKSAPNKIILDPLDFDKLFDGINEEKNEDTINNETDFKLNDNKNKKENKKDKKANIFTIDLESKDSSDPLQLFERNLMNYLNLTTKDIIPVFLSELKFNLEELSNFDHQIHDFLTRLRYDIEAIIDEQSTIINNEMNKDRNYLNFGFYFDELTLPNYSLYNQSENNKDETTKYRPTIDILNNVDNFVNKLQVSKDKMIESSFSKLKAIKSESNHLKNNLQKLNNSAETRKKLSNIKYIIEKEEITIHLYDKRINEICQRQAKIRNNYKELYNYKKKSLQIYNDDNDEENDYEFLKDELLEIIKYFKLGKKAQKKLTLSEFYDKNNSNLISIKSDLTELSEKLKYIEHLQSSKQSNSFCNNFQSSQIQNISMPIDFYSNNLSFMNTSQNLSMRNKIRSNNSVVSDVKKKLENIQKISRENNYMLSNM